MIVSQFVIVVSVVVCLSPLWSEGNKVETKWSIGAPELVKQSRYFSRSIRAVRSRRSLTEEYVFDDLEKATAVDAHNYARRNVIPAAADMQKMVWDDDLAAQALTSSQLCLFEHNSQRGANFDYYVGENIYVSAGVPFNNNYINGSIISWDSEKQYYNYATGSCNNVCGHYTQVVWSTSYKVGCAAARCSVIDVFGQNWQDATLLFCNYGTGGNIVGYKPYQQVNNNYPNPCSACQSNNNYCDDGLCTDENSSSDWGNWGSWSTCSQTCDGGDRWRVRECNSEECADDYDGSYEHQFCNTHSCNGTPPPETTTTTTTTPATTTTTTSGTTQSCCTGGDTEWSGWSNWSCDSGTCDKSRSRVKRKCEYGYACYTYTQTQYTQCDVC